MSKTFFLFLFLSVFGCSMFISSCKNSNKPSGSDIAHSPKELQQKATDQIESLLRFANENKGKIDDSLTLIQPKSVDFLYSTNDKSTLWSGDETWKPLGDSLFAFIAQSKLYGLFPEDYHFEQLSLIRSKVSTDPDAETNKKDAALWARADVMLTDAFVQLIKDIKIGRLPNDSISMRTDSVLKKEFYAREFDSIRQKGSIDLVMESLEPKVEGYYLLKRGIKKFLDSATDKTYTYVPAPSKGASAYKQALQKRLFEGGFIASDSVAYDSAQLSAGLKKFQEKNRITADGKIGNETLRVMNTTDKQRFVQIAINMDRYKMLPPKMPEKFVWVNLPSYYLQVWEGDSVKFISRIVCGKPTTRSPVLTSAIAELITYPKWTIPASIIEKEILPGVKKNPKYLQKKGYTLVDKKGNEVDPDSVNWSKYTKAIPYHVVQGSGDANALGVLKFNFNNKYAVYLHDTNERYLFGRNDRDMSHGCIRVQAWQQLAYYVLDNDNADGKADLRVDSMQHWLKKKEKHSIGIKNRLPLFIRYFTCEGKNGSVVFYDDIYGDDKTIADKYFAKK